VGTGDVAEACEDDEPDGGQRDPGHGR
jgi:hypothetical protein